jgi:putative ABC transport system permease protein
VFLALAEVRRAKARFGLLTGAVALLVFLLVFLQAILGALLGSFTGGLEGQSGKVLVYSDDARGSLLSSTVEVSAVKRVRAVDGVAAAGPFGQATFTVQRSSGLADVTVLGYALGEPGSPTRLVRGRLPQAPGEAVASAGGEAELELGEETTLQPSGEVVSVVGVAEDSQFNTQTTLFVAYQTYARAVADPPPESAGGAVPVPPSAVAVRPAEGTSPAMLAEAISAELAEATAFSRAEAVSSLSGVSAIQQSFGILLGLAFVVLVLVSGVFFVILTVQKRETLTLLRAVGAGAGDLAVSLMLQVVGVSLVGVLAGVALTVLVSSVAGGLSISVEPGPAAAFGAAVVALSVVAATASVRRVLAIDPASVATGRGQL